MVNKFVVKDGIVSGNGVSIEVVNGDTLLRPLPGVEPTAQDWRDAQKALDDYNRLSGGPPFWKGPKTGR